MKNRKMTDAEVMDNLHLMTEEELQEYGWRRVPFDEIPRIKVDNIEEYARTHGYINQEEYNKWLNNLLK